MLVAPREGCDITASIFSALSTAISIHAPREGCDIGWTNRHTRPKRFQSTHPVRGATLMEQIACDLLDISIHAPREGCDARYAPIWTKTGRFQSTHPVRGATAAGRIYDMFDRVFQSTHPVRGATVKSLSKAFRDNISIHAPREGCAVKQKRIILHDIKFQSTHPVRGATRRGCPIPLHRYFNPRTP